VKTDTATLDKLAYPSVLAALAERARTGFGKDLIDALQPGLAATEVSEAHERVHEVLSGGDLSLGGIHDIRPLLERVLEGNMLEGSEILEIAYTFDSAGTIKRAIANSERPALGRVAESMGTFDGALRLVREQVDTDGQVRDDATPKLRDIRRRLNPLRGRIRERLQHIINRNGEHIQDPIITLRRERYVIPVKASSQSRIPGIVLGTSDSGATVFVEPQSVVPMNNELALLEFEERDEVRRILIALGQRLAHEPGVDETLASLALLDLTQASAALARDWQLVRPEFVTDGTVSLPEARHPLISNCVPNTIELDQDRRLLIVTGPNAGGKTVLIKTLGLAALMAHSGLYVAAAAGSVPRLPRFEQLLVDIGDEQSIEASLSTYAGHLKNLKRIVLQASDRVLVLIDELGSGTDPAEGAALSQAVLEQVLQRGALGLVTTHLAPLKVFASETDGVLNAAMRFDVELLRPTYQLVPGQPGRSYALAITERLGLPEQLLQRAAEILGPEGERLEELLATLEAQRLDLAGELAAARQASQEAQGEAELLRQQIAMLRRREDEVLAAAAARADEMLQDTLRRAQQLRRTASADSGGRAAALEELQRMRQQAREQARLPETAASVLEQALTGAGPAPRSKAGRKKPASAAARKSKLVLERGATVHVHSYDASGQVLEVRGSEVLVQLGLLKVAVPTSDVRLLHPKEAGRQREVMPLSSGRFENELNVRGERVEAGLEEVRDFITEAHSLRQPVVRIVHGKGTGVLRDAIRRMLKDDQRVETYSDATPYEGGHGVTVVQLRN
jgi:DNA mismatch repair protein MutS2